MFGFGKRKQQSESNAAPVAAPRTEWQSLPPIQRTMDTMEPVADLSSFEAGLATRAYPGVVSSMSHEIDADGPVGTVVGVPTTAAAPAPMRWARPPTSAATAITAQTAITTPSPPPAESSTFDTQARNEPPPMAPTPTAVDVTPADTSVPAPAEVAERASTSAPLVGQEPPATSLPLPIVAPTTEKLSSAPTAAPVDPAPRPARRLGLGAPIPQQSPTLSVQRAPQDAGPAAPTRRRTLGSAPPTTHAKPSESSTRGGLVGGSSDLPTVGNASVPAPVAAPSSVELRAALGDELPAVRSEQPVVRMPTVQLLARSATTAPPTRSAPLVGASPLTVFQPGATASRASATPAAPPATPVRGAARVPAAIAARSDSGVEPWPQEPVYEHVPRAEPVVQRQVLGAGPVPLSSPSPRTQRPVAPASTTASAALSTGLATMESDGVVVFRSPDEDAETSVTTTTSPPPAVAAPAATTAPPTAAANTGVDMKQLDALTHAVYGRVSDRIKAELRLDRERSGRLIEHGLA